MNPKNSFGQITLVAASLFGLLLWSCDDDKVDDTPISVEQLVGDGGVLSAERLEVRIYGVKPILPGEPRKFEAIFVNLNGRETDVTEEVEWSSSNEMLVDFAGGASQGAGWALVPEGANGAVTVTARYNDMEGQLHSCTYPSDFDPYLRPIREELQLDCPCELNDPLPYVYWENAFHPGGAQAPLRFADLHCQEETSIIILVLGTNWCTACTSFMERLAERSQELTDAGAEIVFVQVEDEARESCSSDEAQRHISRKIGNEVGYRVGDEDSRPGNGNYFTNAGLVESYPTVAIVRRRDMRVIADNSTGAALLDLVEVARDPERDWTVPYVPEVVDRCGGQNEGSEPNDEPTQAAPLAPGTILGGICDANSDYYQIDVMGGWRLELSFENSVGDLDVVIWDEANDSVARGPDGLVLGAYTTADVEVFEYMGPALIRVYGFNYESAPYSLTLTTLD